MRRPADRLTCHSAPSAAAYIRPPSGEILGDIRSALCGNLCFDPVSAMARATLDVVAIDLDTRGRSEVTMIEAQQVAERLGATLRVDVERRIHGAAKVGAHRTSMLQDLDTGRALESDALVTAVQERAGIVGVKTPAPDAILALIQQLGRS